MTRKELYHQINYIDWQSEARVVKITIAEAEAKIEFLKKHGQEAKSKTRRVDWIKNNTWSIVKTGYWRSLAVYEGEEYIRYTWHSGDDKKNQEGYRNPGAEAAKLFNARFRDRTGITLRGAFGYLSDDESFVSKCIPKPIYYINNFFTSRICTGVNKGDFSSNYPSNLRGELPDIRTAKIVQGEVDPSPEYPFAFYSNRHCAEYGRFDTRKYQEYGKISERLLYSDSKCKHLRYIGDITSTILCKASAYKLDDEIRYFYDLKEQGDRDAKLVMNATIGMFHQSKTKKKSYRLAHLAAICIGRANQEVIEAAYRIGRENVLQIVVDGIIYFNCGYDITQKKDLGKFVLQIDSADFRMIGVNQYLFIDPESNKVLEIKAASFDSPNVATTSTFEQMDEWRRK